MFEPQVVGKPAVRKMSLRAMGTPSHADRGWPARRRASLARAWARAATSASLSTRRARRATRCTSARSMAGVSCSGLMGVTVVVFAGKEVQHARPIPLFAHDLAQGRFVEEDAVALKAAQHDH